jgi:hypothetical protein
LFGVFFAVLNSASNQSIVGSTSRARALSRLWTGFVSKGLQAGLTSRARLSNRLGAFEFDLQTGSTSRARLSSLFVGQKLTNQSISGSTSRARALNLKWIGSFALFIILMSLPLLPLTTNYSPFTSAPAEAATSNTLNFQGRLLTNTGSLVPDGTYNMEFNLYYVASGGTTQWTEDRLNTNTQGVTVKNGYFSVYLGEYDNIPALNWSEDLYLGMTIRGTGSCAWGSCTPADSEMTPRFKLTAVPYAFRAANVASSNTNAGSTNTDGVSITTGNALGATSNSGNITIDAGTATGTTGQILLGTNNASALTIGRAGVTSTLQGSVALTGAGTALTVTNDSAFNGNTTIGNATSDTLTVEANATFNGSLTVSTGDTFINSGATLNTALLINDVSGGGNIGTAAATVDGVTTFNIDQDTASQALTLPTPTNTTGGRVVYVNNIGSVSFTMYGTTIGVNGSNAFIWNGTQWITTVSLSGSSVSVVGTIDSQTKNADGAVIVGNAIYFQTADASNVGLVSTAAQTFAGAKTFNNGIILAAGQSLTVTGGNTTSRPGSPTEGMVYFDTTTDSLLTYANGKWQSDRGEYVVVAANDSTQAEKDSADYVADGTADQTEINSALTEAAGGKVILLAGTYVANATILIPNNTTLAGSGPGTVIELANLDATENLIENSDATTGTNVAIRDLTLNGRKDLNTAGTQYGIYLDDMGSQYRTGATISNVYGQDFRNSAIYILADSGNNSIMESTFEDNTDAGIQLGGNSYGNNISDNMFINNGYGLALTTTSAVIANNSFIGGGVSIVLFGANDNIITGNNIKDSGGGGNDNNAIVISTDSDNNQIINNYIHDGGCSVTCYAITIDATSDNNYLEGNRLSDNDGTNNASINDSSTSTIYAGQQAGTASSNNVSDFRFRGSANSTTAFAVQNASGTSILNVDSQNQELEVIGNTIITGKTTGDALTVNNSTSTGNIFVAQDNGTPVFTIADGGAITTTGTLLLGTLGSTDNSSFLCRNTSNIISGCNFTPLSSSITDNIADAFDLQEGTNNYININTTNTTENISFGNATTNPSYNFLGSGTLNVAGATAISGLLTANAGATISGATINLNASSNFATNINTGTSTGAVTIGNSAAGAIAIQSASTVGLTGTTTVTGLSSGVALTVNNSTSTGDIFVAQDNGVTAFRIADGGNVGLNASAYLNFGATLGTSGYGIRDNAGVLEVKDSSGCWFALDGGGCATLTAPTLASTTSYSPGSTAANSTLTVPTGTANGDLLVAYVMTGGGSAPTPATPAGWTLLDSAFDNGTDDVRISVFYKIASGDTPGGSVVFTHASAYRSGSMLRIINADTSTPFNTFASRTRASDPQVGFPAVTTTSASTLGIGLASSWNDVHAGSSIPNWTNIVAFDANYGRVDTRAFATAATYAAEESAVTETNSYLAYTLAINPSSTSPRGNANRSLSNLSNVSLNTSLLPGASGTIDLGSSSARFKDLFLTNNIDLTATANTTGNLVNIANTTASQTTATALNVVQSGTTTGYTGNFVNFTGSSTTGTGNLLNLTSVNTTNGNALNVTSNALTTGNAVNINSTSTGLTTGSLLRVSTATTGAIATNGAVQLSATGNYTSTSNVGLLSVQANTTQAGTIQNINGNALTTGQALYVSSTGTGLTTGSLLFTTSATTGAVATNGINSLNATGNYTSTTNAGLLDVKANATTAGTVTRIQGNALTTGQALYVSSTGTGLTTGSLGFFTSATTGAVATNGIFSLNATGNYTSTANAGLLNVTANATTAGTIVNIQGTGLTTGTALNINSGAGTAINTTSAITNSGAAQVINVTLGNDADQDLVAGLQINPISVNASDFDNFAGIYLAPITAYSDTWEVGVAVGSGYDLDFSVNDTDFVFGVGNGGTYNFSAYNGATFDTLLTLTDAGSVGNLGVTGTLSVATLGTADTSTYLCRNTSNIISGCVASPLTNALTDNIADAFDLQEGTNNYININTTNTTENISFGNATTNPSYNFLGSGEVDIAGTLTVNDGLNVNQTGASYLEVYDDGGGGGDDIALRIRSNSSDAINVQNASGVEIFSVGGSYTNIGGASFAGTLSIADGSSNYIDIVSSAQSGDYQVSFPALSGNTTFCLQSNNCGYIASALTDNIADALDIQEGTNNYININTTDASENISFGNATTNPSYSFLGSGTLAVAGSQTIANNLTVDTNTLFVDATNNRVGIGTASPGVSLDVLSTGNVFEFTRNYTVDANTVRTIGTFTREYSAGAGADGIGTSLGFDVETETSGVIERAGSIDVVTTDATAGTLDSYISLIPYLNGVSVSTALTVSGTGTSVGGTLGVTGLTTLNGGLTVETGDTFTFNADAFTDFTGGGLVNTGGVLTVDATSATGFFQNGGNNFGGAATLGTTGAGQNLSVTTGTTGVLSLDTGTTGAINIGTSANAKTITIGASAATATTSTVNIANSTGALQAVTIGSNANFASTLALQGGNGATAITLTPQTTGQIVVGAAAGTGQITLGSSSASQTVVVGGGSGISTVQIAGGTAANVVQIANTQTGGSVSIGDLQTSGTISIGGGTAVRTGDIVIGSTGTTSGRLRLFGGTGTGGVGGGTSGIDIITAGNGTINIGNGSGGGAITLGSSTAIQAVNIANGAGAPTVNIANTSVAGATVSIAGAANTTANVISIANGASAANSTVNILSGVGTAGVGVLNLGNNTRVTTIDIGNIAAAAARTINLGTGNNTVAADTINIGTGNTTVAGGKTINIGTGTPTGAGSNLISIGSTALASSTTLNAGTGLLNFNATNAQFTEVTGTRTLGVQTRTSGVAGTNLTVQAGAGGAGAGFAGGTLTLQGGSAGGTNANGGNISLVGGAGTGTGVKGLVVLDTATYSSATVQAFPASGNITQSNIDSFGTILLNPSASGWTATLTDPTNTTAGRLIYVSNTSLLFDIILAANSGSETITLKPNTTATMIWTGIDWTAAGASSATDLQAAYDNTATSAGGAELVLNAAGGAADGLTIRNNATTPIVGGLLEVQTSIGSNLFTVNNNATEYANNGGSESATYTMWTGAFAGGTVTRNTTAANTATGQGSTSVVTAATIGHGAENTLTTTLTPNLKYSVSYTVKGVTNFTTLETVYSRDGSNTSTTSCNNAQTVTTSQFTRINCTFIAPASGITGLNSIFIRQTDAVARTFYIDNLSTTVSADVNHASDGSVDLALGTNWTDFGANTAGTTAAVRNTTVLYDTSGSVEKTTGATADRGIINNLSINPSINTQYLVTFYARSSNTFNDIRVRYSRDGGTNFASCTDYNTQSVSTSTYTKITCIFTTDGSAPSNADLVIDQPTATARTFYVDALTITLNTNNSNNVQIGGGTKGGPTTLFTLDRSAGAPIAANNDAYLGSMYYDTTTGRIQCYEADGWGACGAAPDNIVNLNPEYAGAVLNGTGVGTMTADFCAEQSGVLNVNTALCGVGEAKNYYKWTSPQATQQTYSIFVTYQLPATFNGFSSDDTIQLTALTDSTTNAAVTYEVFKSTGSAVTQCGTGETTVVTSANVWQSVGINGNESTGCSFNSSSAGNFVIFKINMKANSNANAYVSTLSFVTTGR